MEAQKRSERCRGKMPLTMEDAHPWGSQIFRGAKTTLVLFHLAHRSI